MFVDGEVIHMLYVNTKKNLCSNCYLKWMSVKEMSVKKMSVNFGI